MRSVEVALRTLESITEHQVIGVRELSRTLALPKSTVQRSLETLARLGWIEGTGEDQRKWRIATKAIIRIQQAAGRRGSLHLQAAKEMSSLRDATGETVVFSVRDGDQVLTIDQVESVHPVRISIPPGSHALAHRTCAGMAMASRWTEQEVDRYAAEYLSQDPDAEAYFRERIAFGNANGFVVSTLRVDEGLVAAAAPIIDSAGRPVAALTLSAPSVRTSTADLESIGPQVAAAAARVTS